MESDTKMNVRVVSEANIPLKAKWVSEGRFDLTSQSAGEHMPFCMETKSGYATRDGGPYRARGIFQASLQTFGVMVRGDSGIETPHDIKPGMRMAVFDVPGGMDVVQAVLAWGNLTVDDVVLVKSGSYPGQMRFIPEGKADVCAVAMPSATTVMEAAASPHGISFVDLNGQKDPEGEARFHEYLPVHVVAPMRVGVAEATETGKWGWGSPGIYWTRAEQDANLTYNLAKWWSEKYDIYKDAHPTFVDHSLESFKNTVDAAYFPLHEGTIKYLKEQDLWSEANERRQEYHVKLIDLYIEYYQEAIDAADLAGVTIDPENQEWQDFWADYKEDRGLPGFRILTDAQIEEGLELLETL
jgi:TRAP-type uncharacterized transport system substrate-binding protein